MKNNRHIPDVLKSFNKHLEQLSRKHGTYTIFEDFLDMTINAFCFNHSINLPNLQKKYTLDERHQFGKMIHELLNIQKQMIKSDTCWYDALGTIYENQSLSKQKYFAQFFTPIPICTFMAQIVDVTNANNLHEPAAGSGRFCLAANSINPKMFHYAIDLDYTCARMTAINFMTHGIDGIIISDDGLWPKNNFRGAFIVNRNLKYTGVPQIEYVGTANEAYRYVSYRDKLRTGNIYLEQSIPSDVDIKTIEDLNFKHKSYSSTEQLKLF